MSTHKVQIGCKLPLGWQSAVDWPDLARRADLLPHLAEMGFDYVEFGVGSLHSADERGLLQEQVEACGGAALGMALHPYLGGQAKIARFERGPECRRSLNRLLEAADRAAEEVPGTVTLVFHPAEDDYDPATQCAPEVRSELLRLSRLFARELEDRITPLGRGVVAALEHQVPPAPEENLLRTGDTAQELLRVVEGTDLPICWDTGHYLLSMDRHGQPARPPKEFLRRVTHVHLHDVIEGRDHRAISEDSHHVRRWIDDLLRRGFDGRLTLEYEPDAVWEGGGVDRVAAESLRLLRQWGVN